MKPFQTTLLITAVLTIILLDAYGVFALTTNTFTDGTTNGNFTYSQGNESPTRTIQLSPYVSVTNAVLYLKGYANSSSLQNTSVFANNGSLGYAGQWNCTGTPINPSYSNDGLWNNYAACTGGSNYPEWRGNFSVVSPSSVLHTFMHHFAAGENYISLACANTTNNNQWIIYYNDVGRGSYFNISAYLPLACYNNTNLVQVKINTTIVTGGPYFALWDNELVYNTTVGYPHNVTVFMNNQSTIYNFGSANASAFNVINLVNLTQYFNYSGISLWNLSFFSNTSGVLEYSNLSVTYADTINITFKTELTDELFKSYVTANLINTNDSYVQKSTITGYLDFDISYAGINTIEYYDNNGLVPNRYYYYQNTPPHSQNATLYVINLTNTTQVVVTVYDYSGNLKEGYYLKVLRRYVPTNEYFAVEMHKLDQSGQALMNVNLYYDLYVFQVYDESLNLVYTTGATEVKSTSITIVLPNPDGDLWTGLENIFGLDIKMPTYNSATRQFSTTWNDASDLIDYIDFKTYRRTIDFGDVIICENQSSANSGTLYCTIDPTLPGSYVSEIWIETTTNHSYDYLGSTEWQSPDAANNMGRMGIFGVVILEIGAVMLGLWNPAVGIVLCLAILGLSVLMKLIVISVSTIVVLIILGGYLIVKGRI